MALAAYLTQTQRLLQNPAAPTSLYSTADLTSYINIARGQLAAEGQCLRTQGTLTTSVGTRTYGFASITIPNTGMQGIIHVRQVLRSVGGGGGYVPLQVTAWEWFSQFYLGGGIPTPDIPQRWAQYGQGSAPNPAVTNEVGGGTFYLDPIPNGSYNLLLDCVCYPIALTSDATVEAIPYLWTDAVPFFAAYYALLSAQTSTRLEDANRMFAAYQQFLGRARTFANPDINRHFFEQAPDNAMINKLGVSQKTAGGQQ